MDSIDCLKQEALDLIDHHDCMVNELNRMIYSVRRCRTLNGIIKKYDSIINDLYYFNDIDLY